MFNNLNSSVPEESINPAHALVGKTLKTGWYVKEKVVAKPGSTGSHFSVCYLAEKDGVTGFLKALNLLRFLQDDDDDIVSGLSKMAQTFEYERNLLSRCRDSRLTKVSKILEAGQEKLPGFMAGNVAYLIFEKADGDVRSHLNFTNKVDTAWKLRSLHNIAVGLKQLHSIEISHQDLKPSNVFVFEKTVSKLGDLGRSLCKTLEGPHSKEHFTGDWGYAPPEVFFRYALPEWTDRVLAIDCYMLGSMCSFYFTGLNMTALISQHLDHGIDWNNYSGGYESALPYFISAFDDALLTFEAHLGELPFGDRKELVSVVRMLCHPNPAERGHPRTHLIKGNNYKLERFVQIFNRLAFKAEHKLTR